MEKRIISLFYDSYGRARITPRHESSIVVMLEDEYSSGKIKSGLQRLVDSGILKNTRIHVERIGTVKFYFLSEFHGTKVEERIKIKIQRSVQWIQKQSNKKIKMMLGDHLHDLVKNELKIHNFQILAEKNVHSYNNKTWTKTNHTLDLLAKHNKINLVLGIEIKNSLPLPALYEIKTKIDMCKYLGITPMFAVRWMESYRNIIEKNNGFLWQFKKQLFPRGQEFLAESLRKRFKFPCYVEGELPIEHVTYFENWLQNTPKTLSL